MALLQRGEIGALDRLYDRHHRLALALAWRIVGNREMAEEIVQEAYLAIWRHAAGHRPALGGVRTWLFSIVRHRAIDQLRRRSARQPTVELEGPLADERSPELLRVVEQSDARQRVRRALADLPREQRQAVDLAYYGGLTQQEIAERVGVPLGTVKGRLRLAMEKLRLMLVDLAPEVDTRSA